MPKKPLPDDLPADLRAYLESVPPATPEMVQRVARANRDAQDEPVFQADLIKMTFVNEMMSALEERKESKSSLADRLGKTRQYIQKLFSEDQRVNFTVDTLCSVAQALGRRIHLNICREHEQLVIVSRPCRPITIKASAWERPEPMVYVSYHADRFVRTSSPKPYVNKEEPIEHATAA